MKQRVRVLKDIPEVKLVKRKIGPWVTGDELELWVWDVAVLKRQGVAEVHQPTTASEIRMLVLAEERSLELSPLPEGFYNSIARGVSTLLHEGKKEAANELMSQTFSLLELRMPKLIRLALSPEVPSGLTPEEHFLANNVTETVENWNRRLREFFEFREEVGKNEEGKSVQRVAGDKADIQKQGVSEAELYTRGAAT
ncbi:MAG: hypothetical protein ABH852_02470 [Methanobacteriota archaeon]